MKEKIDIILLNSAHSIITPHKREKIPISEFIVDKGTEVDHSQNGLFNVTSPDFNTYYPGENADSVKPEDEDFIFPVYRLLSEIVVNKMSSPVDFSQNDVLKNSMPLLQNLTIYSGHEELIGNHLGSVVEVAWQDSYKYKGVTIPPGVNGVLKVDAKANPKIARGILQDPPAIHSVSLSVLYKWVKSHDMPDDEFYNKLGTYNDKKELIRKIASEIILYTELSLVPHGADPFAQLLKDGKINNPQWAKKFYALGDSRLSCVDFNRSYTGDLEVEINSLSFKPNINNPPKSEENMDEFITKLGKVVGYSETDQEKLLAHVSKLISDNLANEKQYADENAQLKKDNEKLKSDLKQEKEGNVQLKNDQPYIEVGKNHLKTVRDEAVKFYTSVKGDKKDDNIIKIIENSDLEAAKAFLGEYREKFEELTPLTCQDCNSKNIERASASQEDGEDGGKGEKFTYRSNMEVIEQRKRKRFAEKNKGN